MPRRRKAVRGLDVPHGTVITEELADELGIEIPPPLPPEGMAECSGPRLLLSPRGSCVIVGPRSMRTTLCGAAALDGRDFYERPLVFSALTRVWRVDVLAALRAALPALRAAGLCPTCAAALSEEKEKRWDLARLVDLRSNGLSKRQAQALAEVVLSHVDRGASWLQLRGHEVPIQQDPKMEEGAVRVLRAEHEGQVYYVVRCNVPTDRPLQGAM